MPSVLRINGRRVASSRDYREGVVAGSDPSQTAFVTSGENVARPTDGTPIPAESPDSPFREGEGYHDEHDDVVYRVVTNLRIAEGWGTAKFWLQRWSCLHADLLQLTRMGWLDAAMEPEGLVKRYRCRDELRVREWVAQRLRERERPAPTPERVLSAPIVRKPATPGRKPLRF